MFTDKLELSMDRVHRPNANQTRSSQHDVYTDTEIRMKATRKMKGSTVFIGEDCSQ